MRKRLPIFLLALTLLLGACASPKAAKSADTTAAAATATTAAAAAGTYKTLTPEEAYARMTSGDKNVVIVDVRRADEYETKHIKGAILVPNEEIGTTQPKLLPDLNAELLVYCRTGIRAADASAKLAAMGYTNVNDIGGITTWPYDNTASGAFDAAAAETTAASASAAASDGLLGSFTATDIEGNAVDQTIFSGHKLTMLNIWATYCGPCLNEMPELGKLSAEYADKGVQIVGVVADAVTSKGEADPDQTKLAQELAKSTGATYTHLVPSKDLIEKILFKVQAVPTTYFFDEKGALVGKAVVGSQSKDGWASIIDQRLAELGA